MSLDEKKPEESEKHTQTKDCPVCKERKELSGSTARVCYESASPQAGEDTKRF